MALRLTACVFGRFYTFASVKEVMNKANELRSGDVQAGLSAQSDRERVMGALRTGRVTYLVATDVAARGIDIPHLSHVVNYGFPESAEAQQLGRKLILPPGPNNPVGLAWIGLSKPGYGIHGTPAPEQVGRTESHGCFRLANWNAEYLVKLVSVGTPVRIVE